MDYIQAQVLIISYYFTFCLGPTEENYHEPGRKCPEKEKRKTRAYNPQNELAGLIGAC